MALTSGTQAPDLPGLRVNGATFDTTVPFGGYKQSGVGREDGPEGLAGSLEMKSVHMSAGPGVSRS
jgi:acyl-CoA reductase-like NAD-dependent aldehyde dehydrogenase